MEKGIILRHHWGGEGSILQVRPKGIGGGQHQKHKKKVKFIDRRHHPRHLLGLPIKYYLADMEIGRPGFILNISEVGSAIEISEELKVGDDLKLKTLHKAQGSIEIIGKVVWIKPPGRSGEAHQSTVFASFIRLEKVERMMEAGNMKTVMVNCP